MRLSHYLKRYNHPLLKGMGSVIDIFGVSHQEINLNLSSGWEKDAEAIMNDFSIVGMDIQKAIENYQSSSLDIRR